MPDLQVISPLPHALSTGVDSAVAEGDACIGPSRAPRRDLHLACALRRLWRTASETPRLYWPRAARNRAVLLRLLRTRETDLPAQRAPAEAQARLPRADVHARRPRDPQAPPRPGPQAALGLSSLDARVQRRHRLSPLARLRRRLPARPLGLDALPRPVLVPARRRAEASRPARASPCRRRVGSGGRPQPDQAAAARGLARARLEHVAAGPDYVLVVRPGLAEARRGPRASTGSASASTRSSGRRRREARCSMTRESLRARYLGLVLVYAWRWTLGLLSHGTCKYHPTCSQYALDALRQARPRAGLDRWPAGGCCAAIRGAAAASTTRMIRGSSGDPRLALTPIENVLARRPRVAPRTARSACLGLVDRRADDHRADRCSCR